jgi:hypothetical protein
MQNYQENKLRMYKTVSACLEAHAALVTSVPSFDKMRLEFAGLIARIGETDMLIRGATDGKTAHKRDTREALMAALLPVASVLALYAHEAGMQDVKAAADHSETAFRAFRELELLNRATDIMRSADDRAEAIEAYGVTAAMRDSLRKGIADYEAAIDGREAGGVTRMSARAALSRLFEEADTLLNESMDRQMEIFRATQPGFYEEYFNARSIKLLGIRHRRPEEAPPPLPAAS